MVHLYTWFKFYFPLFETHYHTSPYSKIMENKIQTKDKIIILLLNHKIYKVN